MRFSAIAFAAAWTAISAGTISTPTSGVTASPATDAGLRVPVAEDFTLHCAACHRLDGTGTPGVVPTLHGVGKILASPAGRAYLARVPGVAQAPLSDARLARLLNWVLLEFSGASPQPRYSAQEMGRLRTSPLRDPASVRKTLLEGLNPDSER